MVTQGASALSVGGGAIDNLTCMELLFSHCMYCMVVFTYVELILCTVQYIMAVYGSTVQHCSLGKCMNVLFGYIMELLFRHHIVNSYNPALYHRKPYGGYQHKLPHRAPSTIRPTLFPKPLVLT